MKKHSKEILPIGLEVSHYMYDEARGRVLNCKPLEGTSEFECLINWNGHHRLNDGWYMNGTLILIDEYFMAYVTDFQERIKDRLKC